MSQEFRMKPQNKNYTITNIFKNLNKTPDQKHHAKPTRDIKALFDSYVSFLKKNFGRILRNAPSNTDRIIIMDMIKLFENYGYKYILNAKDYNTAARNYSKLIARLFNIYFAIMNAWRHKANLIWYRRGRCRYATTSFPIGEIIIWGGINRAKIHYEFCEDHDGILRVFARINNEMPIILPKPKKPITIPRPPINKPKPQILIKR